MGCRQGSLPAPLAPKRPNLLAACPLCIPGTGRDDKHSTQHPPTAISPGGAWGRVPWHFGQSLAVPPPCLPSSSGRSLPSLPPGAMGLPGILHFAAQKQPPATSPGGGLAQHPAPSGKGLSAPGTFLTYHRLPSPSTLRSIHPTSRHRVQPGQRPLAASFPAMVPGCAPRSAQGAHGKGPKVEGREG